MLRISLGIECIQYMEVTVAKEKDDSSVVENHLRDIISELKSDSSNSTFILYSIRNTISPEVRTRILDTINSMLDEIRLMKDKFALESEEKTVRQSILGHLSGIWTTLEDTRPEKMSGILTCTIFKNKYRLIESH